MSVDRPIVQLKENTQQKYQNKNSYQYESIQYILEFSMCENRIIRSGLPYISR